MSNWWLITTDWCKNCWSNMTKSSLCVVVTTTGRWAAWEDLACTSSRTSTSTCETPWMLGWGCPSLWDTSTPSSDTSNPWDTSTPATTSGVGIAVLVWLSGRSAWPWWTNWKTRWCQSQAKEDWKSIQQFQEQWNGLHALGTLDGKHVAIKKPPMSGSVCYSCNAFFPLALMALVDTDNRFIWIDTREEGYQSDRQLPQWQTHAEWRQRGALLHLGYDNYSLWTYLMRLHGRRGLSNEEIVIWDMTCQRTP